MRPTTQAVCRALAALSLVAAGLWSPFLASADSGPHAGAVNSPGLPAAPVPQSYAGPCTDDLGVTVVVDFRDLGGATVVRCAPGSGGQPFQGTGLEAIQAAGIQLAGTSQHGLSVVCRVNGRPAPDEELSIPGDDAYIEQCAQMPPASAFWSYWQADNGGSWAFSQRGVTSTTARAGGFEGLSFSLNSTAGAPPRMAPSRPSPEPSPTPEPEPSPSDPEPSPSEPEPSPTEPEPTPPPSDNPPGDNPPSDSPPTQDPTPAPAPSPPSDPAPEPEPAPAPDPAPGPSPDDPATSSSAPPSSDPGPEPDPTDDAEQAAPDDASPTTSDPTPGDGESATTAPPETAADGAEATSPPVTTDDATSDAASEQFTADPTDDGGGAGALWVTVGVLLLLGLLTFLASRRRRDPGLTHEVEP